MDGGAGHDDHLVTRGAADRVGAAGVVEQRRAGSDGQPHLPGLEEAASIREALTHLVSVVRGHTSETL